MYTVFHMRVRPSIMDKVIFNRRSGSVWGQEVHKGPRNPIQVGKEYTLRLEIQGNIIKVLTCLIWLNITSWTLKCMIHI